MATARVSAWFMVVAASLASCRSTHDVGYSGEVRVTSPQLVAIGPGVQVLADADEPIFYSAGSYWLYRDGYWFRSASYRSGYARVDYATVPPQLRVIARPDQYANYQRNMARHQARTSQTRTRSTQPSSTQPMPPAIVEAAPPDPYPGTTFPTRQPTTPPPPPVPPQKPVDPTAPHPEEPAEPTAEVSPERPTTPAGEDAPVQAPPAPEPPTTPE